MQLRTHRGLRLWLWLNGLDGGPAHLEWLAAAPRNKGLPGLQHFFQCLQIEERMCSDKECVWTQDKYR